MTKTYRAYVLIFSISILWGTIPLIIKTTSISSLGLVGVRTLVGSITLFLFIDKSKKNLSTILKHGLILGPLLAIHWATMFESINLNSVAVGIGLVFTYPIFLILIKIFMGIPTKRIQLYLVVFGFFGVYLLLGIDKISSNLGILYGLLSAFTLALLIIYGEPLTKTLGGLNVAFSQVSIAALCLIPFTLNNIDWISNNISVSLFLGAVLTGLGLAIYWYCLKIITPLAVGTITYMEPFTGVLLSSILLGESLSFNQYLGFAIVLSVGIIQVLKVK